MAYDATEHTIGHGFNVAFSDTGTGTFISIDGTLDVQIPDSELGEAETTNDDSPDFHKDFIPGLYDPAKLTFKYKYGRTQFAVVEAVFQLANTAGTRNSATKFWKVTLPDGSTSTFRGFMTKHGLPSAGQEDTLECECEIRVRGKMTFAAATSA